MSDLKPTTFPGVQMALRAPENWDGRLGECKLLPVMVRDGVSVSCWQSDFLGRLRFLWHGKVYLHVVGGQPPVMLTIE